MALAGCAKTGDAGNNTAATAVDTKLARDTATDARRHGPEIAAFAGLKAGDKVIDWIPGGGYWTRTFARIVGPTGHVYGIWASPMPRKRRPMCATIPRSPPIPRSATSARACSRRPNSRRPSQSISFSPRKIITIIADKFMGSLDPAILNKAAFAALKPGGIFLIVDHVAAPGSGMRDTDTLHRIDPEIVKKQVTAAGFAFVGEIRLLAKPADDKTRRCSTNRSAGRPISSS